MSDSEISPDLIDELHLLTRSWNKGLTDDELITFAGIMSQNESNLKKFKEIHNRVLEEISARNYINNDSFTPFSIYLSALETARYPLVPLDAQVPPREWYKHLEFMAGNKIPVSEVFIRVVRWFDQYLSKSSAVVLFLLRISYGEELVIKMAFKLAEFNCDVRGLDFVQIAADWEDKNLDQEFSVWTPEIYRYRTMSDEDLIKSFRISI